MNDCTFWTLFFFFVCFRCWPCFSIPYSFLASWRPKFIKKPWPSTTGMVWHRGTLTWIAAVLALCGGIQLTQCAACVVTFGDVALPGSSVLLGFQPISWIEQSKGASRLQRAKPRMLIIHTLPAHRCVSFYIHIRYISLVKL